MCFVDFFRGMKYNLSRQTQGCLTGKKGNAKCPALWTTQNSYRKAGTHIHGGIYWLKSGCMVMQKKERIFENAKSGQYVTPVLGPHLALPVEKSKSSCYKLVVSIKDVT